MAYLNVLFLLINVNDEAYYSRSLSTKLEANNRMNLFGIYFFLEEEEKSG